ncbi:putative membrane protein YhdT [Falsibacillus pallidus]|uniref:Putative membrane protein YhdT n=1 Tax=Falsibacillus pallidus TaxID=493781 RepID=A0A370GH89_9BACI|nr:putative membrane protein YhdT [Falsibacillus pallidus]
MKEKEKRDWRFKVADRELKIGLLLAVIHFLWWYGFAYGMGNGPVSGYKYIWGLPSWFFYSCIVGFVFITILVILSVKFLFKEVPFEEEGNER